MQKKIVIAVITILLLTTGCTPKVTKKPIVEPVAGVFPLQEAVREDYRLVLSTTKRTPLRLPLESETVVAVYIKDKNDTKNGELLVSIIQGENHRVYADHGPDGSVDAVLIWDKNDPEKRSEPQLTEMSQLLFERAVQKLAVAIKYREQQK